jgi:hypothetical protein
MKKLTEHEIINRLQNAGKKKRKQLLIKLIKLYGGTPIKHMLDTSDGESEWYGSMAWECSNRQLMGFSEYHEYNPSTGESSDEYKSITGDIPVETIIKVVNIIM